MKKSDFIKLAERKGYKTYDRGKEIQISPAPCCGSDPSGHGNVEANINKGVAHCWACRHSSSLQIFIKDYFGKDVDIPVRVDEDDRHKRTKPGLALTESDLSDPHEIKSAERYLEKRGVTAAQIHRYGITVVSNPNHDLYGRVAFPLREYHSGELFGHVARTVSGQKPKYKNTFSSQQVAGFRSSGKPNVHVLVEGVFDGLAVDRAGYQAAVMLGQGGNHLDEWLYSVPPDEKILDIADASDYTAGQRRASYLSRIHGDVSVLELPDDTDPASVGDEKLRALIEEELQ